MLKNDVDECVDLIVRMMSGVKKWPKHVVLDEWKVWANLSALRIVDIDTPEYHPDTLEDNSFLVYRAGIFLVSQIVFSIRNDKSTNYKQGVIVKTVCDVNDIDIAGLIEELKKKLRE